MKDPDVQETQYLIITKEQKKELSPIFQMQYVPSNEKTASSEHPMS